MNDRTPTDIESIEAALRRFAVVALLRERHPMAPDEIAGALDGTSNRGTGAGVAAVLADLADGGLIERVGGVRRQGVAHYRCTIEGTRLVEDWLARRPWDESAAASVENPQATLARERENVERLRTDLLSTVSHELRTPLTLIRTSIGLLLDSEPDEAMQLRLLRNIKQSTDRMNALVTDLLDLVRLRHERTALQMRRVDVGALLSGVAALMRPLIEERQQTLEVTAPRPPPRILGDRQRLERLLVNLVANANKFAPAGSRIRMAAVADADEVTVTVADTGPGIPPEVLPHLFEQFYTARTSSTSHNIGVGLGLPIAKSIAEAHGGRIDVESEVGAGSAFHVALPRRSRRTGATE